MKRHYLIYQITNIVNGKIYIGQHITTNIDDNYFGSGDLLKRAQAKYGLDKFVKTILFELQNKEEMNLLEKCVVTEDFCKRKDVYNIKLGGAGGWDVARTTESTRKGQQAMIQKLKANGTSAFEIWRKKLTPEEYNRRFVQKIRDSFKKPRCKPSRYSMEGNHSIFISNYALRKTIRISKDSALFYDYIAEGWVRCQVKDWSKVPLDAIDASSYPNRIRKKF